MEKKNNHINKRSKKIMLPPTGTNISNTPYENMRSHDNFTESSTLLYKLDDQISSYTLKKTATWFQLLF